MFYIVNDDIVSTQLENIEVDDLRIGFLNIQELEKVAGKIGIDKKAIMMCENEYYKSVSIAECFENYIFLKLRLSFMHSMELNLFIFKNMIIIIDKNNCDDARKIFMSFLSKAVHCDMKIEKLVFLFFETLLENDNSILEGLSKKISKLENAIENNKTGDNFNFKLLTIKNKLVGLRNYYNNLIYISEYLSDNDNEIFENKNIKYFKHIDVKAKRLREMVDFLRENVMQLREAYQSSLELKLNESMKLLTVFTSLFLPLNLISSWYGMNFENMPLINNRNGYLIVIVACVVTFFALLLIFKKKKLM